MALPQANEKRYKSNFRTVVLIVFSVILCSHASASKSAVVDLLRMWIPNDAPVAIVCYKQAWVAKDVTWTKRLPWTVLSLCNDWQHFLKLLRRRTALNHRTTVIVPSGDADIADFLHIFSEDIHYSYLVTWIVFLSSSPDLDILSARVSRPLLCSLILIETDGNAVVKVVASTERYRNCTMREVRAFNGLRSGGDAGSSVGLVRAFSGELVTIGCPVKHYRPGLKMCSPYRRVTDAIRGLNASVVHTVVDLKDFASGLLLKQYDIFMSHVALSKWRFQDLDFPVITHYSHLTFYVRGNSTSPLLFGTVMANSKTALLLLFGSLSSCFLVLLVMDRLGGSRQGYETATRTLFFLIASFYANSTRMPHSRPWKLSRNLLVLSWLLGTFTLTIYIDGKLTSWLSVKVPTDVVDTLDELSDGIEKRVIRPCVVNLSVFHFLSMKSGDHSLLKKLHSAYARLGDGMVSSDVRTCLQCATTEDAVCLMSSVDSCFIRTISEGIKQGEVFGQLFSSTPVRKDFPLKTSYRRLILRLSETGSFGKLGRRTCETATRFERVGDEQLTLGSLYILYFACVATSLLVLTLELCVFYSTVPPKRVDMGETGKKPALCPIDVAEQLALNHQLAVLEINEKGKGS